MSKPDYSNTIIYKITCKNTDVKDIYVGHTTNYSKRKYSHMQCSSNDKYTSYNNKLYTKIREHGGWDNWNMDIIQTYNCKDLYEARVKEQHHYVELNANLNSVEPLKETLIILNNETEVSSMRFECTKCKTYCAKLSDWNRHINTNKHTRVLATRVYTCSTCNKQFSNYKTQWAHTKRCATQPNSSTDYMTIISQLIRQNNDWKDVITKQAYDHRKETVELVNKLIEAQQSK